MKCFVMISEGPSFRRLRSASGGQMRGHLLNGFAARALDEKGEAKLLLAVLERVKEGLTPLLCCISVNIFGPLMALI